VLSDSSVIGNEYGFTGRRYDEKTGLYYFRARYYSPELGRFISRDPLTFVDGMNLYAGYFALWEMTDPYGLCPDRESESPADDSYLFGLTERGDVYDIRNPGSEELINTLDQISENNDKLLYLQLSGHSTSDTVQLDHRDKLDNLTQNEIRSGKIELNMQSGDKSDVISRLNKTTSDKTEIRLKGCNTAFGDDNISRQMSKELSTGATVTGDRTYTGFSGRFDNSSKSWTTFGTKSYQNGKQTSSSWGFE